MLRPFSFARLAGALVLVAALAAPSAGAQAPSPEPTVVPASRYNTSIPVRDMAISPGYYRAFGPYVVPNKLYNFGSNFPTLDEPAPVDDPVRDFGAGIVPFGDAARMPQGEVFIDFDGIKAGNTTPPDPTGAAGPNHYVQMINSRTAVYDRAGNVLLGPVPNNQFWQGLGGECAIKNDGDPIVLYDDAADRWLLSQFAISPGAEAMCVAISATPDPTGAYHQYAFDWPNGFPDYPKLGVWGDSYTLTTVTFQSGGGNLVTGEAVVLDRAAMLAGNAASSVRFNSPTSVVLPANAEGPLPPDARPALFAAVDFFGEPRNEVDMYEIDVDWANPGAATFTTLTSVPTSAFNQRTADIPQPGTTQTLDPLGDRSMMQLQYRRDQGTHETLLFNHTVDVTNIAGVRWYELRKPAASGWTLHQEGTLAPNDGVHRWMGSIAMNADGNIALGYSASSPNDFPSLRFAGQTADQSGTGVLNVPETIIITGPGSQTEGTTRWGDYSHMSVDPDDETFWYIGEYSSGGSAFINWRTRIARLTVGEALDPAIFALAPRALSVSMEPATTLDRDVIVTNTAAAGSADLVVGAVIEDLEQPGDAVSPAQAEARASRDARRAALAADPSLARKAPRAKGAPDAAGSGSARRTGGPDAFGYRFIDSDEPGGPAVDFQDISGTGTTITFSDPDDGQAVIALPFTFPFYGADQTDVRVSTNGYLTFGADGVDFENVPIPNATDPNNVIAPYWDDLHQRSGTAYSGLLADGRFVIQWSNWGRFAPDTGEDHTFQVILSRSGVIEFQYGTITTAVNDGMTVGIENADGTDGLPVAVNAQYVVSDLAVRIVPGAPFIEWATVAPASQSVAPGASAAFTVAFDAADLPEGTYTADLVFSSNDPDNATTTVPLTLTVGPGAAVAGGPGWRMVAPAATGLTVDDLAALNLVQGVPGYYPNAATNLFTGYDGSAFSVTGAGAPLAPGEGTFWYFYDNDLDPGGPSQSVALPMTLTTDNAAVTSDTTVPLSAAGDGSNLLGNPFGTSLDVSDVASWPGSGALSSTVVQAYSAADGGYVTNATTPSLAPWQGFWAEAASSGTLTIPEAARTDGGTFVKRTAAPTLAFELSTADGTRRDVAAVVRFPDAAEAGPDRFDASKRVSAAASFVTLAPEGADGILRAVESRPAPEATPTVVPMHAAATGTDGDVVLTWPTLDLPEDWRAELRDLATGETVDLLTATAYAFSLAPAAARTGEPSVWLAGDAFASKTRDARFELVIGPGQLVSNEGDADAELSLAAPFPNPTGELARVPFTLAEAGPVRLSVVDALGREVAVLADGDRGAGEHAATFDARSLATGLYVIRLAAGGEVLTRRVTVVR